MPVNPTAIFDSIYEKPDSLKDRMASLAYAQEAEKTRQELDATRKKGLQESLYNWELNTTSRFLNNPDNRQLLQGINLNDPIDVEKVRRNYIYNAEYNPHVFDSAIPIFNQNESLLAKLNETSNSDTRITGIKEILPHVNDDGTFGGYSIALKGERPPPEDPGLLRNITDTIGITVPITENRSSDPKDPVRIFSGRAH